MAKQPTPEDLGGLPREAGARPVASYDVSPFAGGAQQIAEAGARFGGALESVAEAADKAERKRLLSEATDANAAIHAGLIGMRARYQDDPDYSTLEHRWDSDSRKIIDDNLGGVSDPGLRTRIVDDIRGPLAQERVAIRGQAFRAAADAHAANRYAFVQNLAQNAPVVPNDALYTGCIDAYHALIDNAVDRGYLAPDAAADEKRRGALTLCSGEYAAMVRRDPMRAIRELEEPDSGHPLVSFLPAEQRDGLITLARDRDGANTVDATRAPLLKDRQARRDSDAAEGAVIQDVLADTPSVTANRILDNDALSEPARDRMLRALARSMQPDPAADASNAAALDLLDRIRRPDGDPDRISGLEPVIEAYNAGTISKSDFGFVAKQLRDAATPEGSLLAQRRRDLIFAARDSLQPEGTAAADGDANAAGGARKLYQLEREIDQKIDRYHSEGRDPNDLFDPTKADFISGASDRSGTFAPTETIGQDLSPSAPSIVPPVANSEAAEAEEARAAAATRLRSSLLHHKSGAATEAIPSLALILGSLASGTGAVPPMITGFMRLMALARNFQRSSRPQAESAEPPDPQEKAILREIAAILTHGSSSEKQQITDPLSAETTESTEKSDKFTESSLIDDLTSARRRLIDASINHLAGSPHQNKLADAIDRGLAARIGDEIGFRDFDSFKNVFGRFWPDEEWHHIVEQHGANVARFGNHAIHSTSNLVKLPYSVHRKISGYYSSKPENTKPFTYRDSMRAKSFEEQHDDGIQVILDNLPPP